MVTKNDDWIVVDLVGEARYMFAERPRKADVEYNKPAMYSVEVVLTDDSKVRFNYGPWVVGKDAVIAALNERSIRITDKHDLLYVKMESKVEGPEDAQKRKPIIKDSQNNDFPSTVLIGNGSKIVARGSILNYMKTPVIKGRKAMNVIFKAVQVLDLVEYKTDREPFSGGPGSFDRVEGYVAGDTPTRVEIGEKKDSTETFDDFSALENTADLEPAKVTTTRRKAA